MNTSWYIYFYKSDSSCEPIGRIKADSIEIAKKYIAEIKRLSVDKVNELFVVESLNSGTK
jgi:hypothetical protein